MVIYDSTACQVVTRMKEKGCVELSSGSAVSEKPNASCTIHIPAPEWLNTGLRSVRHILGRTWATSELEAQIAALNDGVELLPQLRINNVNTHTPPLTMRPTRALRLPASGTSGPGRTPLRVYKPQPTYETYVSPYGPKYVVVHRTLISASDEIPIPGLELTRFSAGRNTSLTLWA